jgi:hypothetical protein
MTLGVSISPTNPTYPVYGLTPSILFTATPSGYSNLTNVTYFWQLGGTNISGANQSTYAYTPNAVGVTQITCFIKDSADGNATSSVSFVTTILECESCGEINNLKVIEDGVTCKCLSCGMDSTYGKMKSSFNTVIGVGDNPIS